MKRKFKVGDIIVTSHNGPFKIRKLEYDRYIFDTSYHSYLLFIDENNWEIEDQMKYAVIGQNKLQDTFRDKGNADLKAQQLANLNSNVSYGVCEKQYEVKVKRKFNLELTESEIQLLADIYLTVGGDPQQSRRKFIDSTLVKIRNNNVMPKGYPDDFEYRYERLYLK